jgi:L-asparaginase II
MQYQPILEITRGNVVESIHYGAIVVADPAGNLCAQWGDADAVTYPRSAAKPFQALPLLESSAAAHFGLTSEEIAVICASHSGTDAHMSVVEAILDRIGMTQEFLGCGTHPPSDQHTIQQLAERGIDPTPIRHSCSGKHAGMLALASYLNEPLDTYLDPQHPIQRLLLSTFAEMCGIAEEKIVIGIDGCSAPTFAVPLRAIATAYARLSDATTLLSKRADACRTVFASMASHPLMVAGEGHFDTLIMQTTGRRIVSKGGAEGFQGFGISPGAIGPESPGLGVVIKIADGNLGKRAGSIVSLYALRELGALEEPEAEALAQNYPRVITNNRGMKTGEVKPCFDLKPRDRQGGG